MSTNFQLNAGNAKMTVSQDIKPTKFFGGSLFTPSMNDSSKSASSDSKSLKEFAISK